MLCVHRLLFFLLMASPVCCSLDASECAHLNQDIPGTSAAGPLSRLKFQQKLIECRSQACLSRSSRDSFYPREDAGAAIVVGHSGKAFVSAPPGSKASLDRALHHLPHGGDFCLSSSLKLALVRRLYLCLNFMWCKAGIENEWVCSCTVCGCHTLFPVCLLPRVQLLLRSRSK